MFRALDRYKWWLLLAVLLLLNVYRYWPVTHASRGFAGGAQPGMGAQGFPPFDAAAQARIEALPDAQRTAVEDRIKEDKVFFASVQSLPDAERWQKVQEHFAQNPPPPGMPLPGGGAPPGGPGGTGGGGPGGPGAPRDGDAPHIPPPDVRRGMDQGLVNAMKNGGQQ